MYAPTHLHSRERGQDDVDESRQAHRTRRLEVGSASGGGRMVIVPRRREHGCRRKLQQIRKALIGSIVLAIALDVVECDAIIVQIALTFTAALVHHLYERDTGGESAKEEVNPSRESSRESSRERRVESRVDKRVERSVERRVET